MANRTIRRFVFTLNNWTDDESFNLHALLSDNNFAKYAVFGREVGDGGTPHLQGFCVLTQPQRFNALRRLLPRAHIEPARGTSEQAAEYCKKDGDYDEFGTFPDRQGQRPGLAAAIDWVAEFTEREGRPPTSPDIAVERPLDYIRYPRLTRLAAHRAAPVQLEFGAPRPWQVELSARLLAEADDRTVIFYVDEDGGKGKTWFQRWFLTNNPGKAQVLGIGKRDDIAYMIDTRCSVFFFNVPRDGMQFIQYTLLEQLKDRLVVSPKYHSTLKVFHHKVHVVVFCNEFPDQTKMSADRFDIKVDF